MLLSRGRLAGALRVVVLMGTMATVMATVMPIMRPLGPVGCRGSQLVLAGVLRPWCNE